MAVLPYDQLYAVMDGAFGDLGPDVVALMTAIAMAESGGNPAAHNNRGEDSRGLGQINIGPGANTDLAGMNLFDPVENAKAMRIVYDRAGPGAWSVYTNRMIDPGFYMDMGGSGIDPNFAMNMGRTDVDPNFYMDMGGQPLIDPTRFSSVMAPRQETKPAAQPLIDPARIGPPDWSMVSPLIRQGGARSPLAPFMQPGVPLVPRLGGM